ncbi:T9SS type A sorting domain-containing protein [Botryobacter ruber]|uniref:T9SS type A sorting domain-containing protein n=1 Tax=Botryobacter ruber TaxID=2171629 RepID=UPI000E0BE1FD|nr:T9SS type A sorting domain-containing protein [Botryobacter ruber]
MIRFYPVLLHFGRQPLLILCFLLIAFGALASDQLHMIPLSLEERIKAADVIVEGEVIAQRSFWDEGHRNIYTSNTIRVYKLFKGEAQPQELELITEGGTVDLEKHVFSAALQLHSGQQGVFFLVKEQALRTTPASSSFTGRAYGSKQGFIRYDLQQHIAADVFTTYPAVQEIYQAIIARTGKSFRVVANNLPLQESLSPEPRIQGNVLAPAISSFSPTTASAGTKTLLTINGSGFGNTRGNGAVKFRNGDDGGQTLVEPYASDYKLWTDTRIQVQIPSVTVQGGPAGSGRIQVVTADGSAVNSSGSIIIQYVYSNVLEENGTTPAPPILVNKNGAGGYSIRFAPSMQSRQQAQEGFRRAMNSWVCNTEINWRIGSPTTIEKSEKDGVSVVVFTQIATNTLAQTISRYSGCRNTSTNEIAWWVDEFDMEINQNINWQYGPAPPTGNQFDFETVVLHELGHAHQLGHVIQPNESVMHYAVAVRTSFRKLVATDITGGNQVMENSFDPVRLALAALCNIKPTSRNTEGDCNLSKEITLADADFNSEGDVDVTWTTSTEQNVSSYIVERSPNGTDWTDIATVAPKGPGSYVFTDTAPLDGTSYYRIRVTYSNTTVPLFSSRVTVISPEVVNTFIVYPNPSHPNTEEVQLQYLIQQETDVTLQLYDYTGKLVKELEHTFIDNIPFTLQVHGLAAGMYILVYSHGSTRGEVKLVKL